MVARAAGGVRTAGSDALRPARTVAEIARLRARIDRIGRLSDGLFSLGPIRIGWDAVLEFVPVVGEAYSLGAGGWMIASAARAGVPVPTLGYAAALIGARTLIGAFDFVPVAGLVGDLLAGAFRGHRRAANLLLKAMDRTLYVEGERTPAREAWAADEMRRTGKARVVFLGR